MARIITVADLREHVETDLAESALQRLIDDADQAVVDRFGPHGSATETVTDDIDADPLGVYVFLGRAASAIASVVEYTSASVSRTLAASDYRLVHGGKTLQRLTTGTTPATVWGYRVVVEYYPSTADNPRRRRIVIDLCKLTLTYGGYIKSERAGDYQSSSSLTPDAYQRERERLMSELGGIRVY